MGHQDKFLYIPGIQGNATHPDHRGWFEIDELIDFKGSPSHTSPSGHLYRLDIGFIGYKGYTTARPLEYLMRNRQRVPAGRLAFRSNGQFQFQFVLANIEVIRVKSESGYTRCSLTTTTAIGIFNYAFRP